jgi:arylsulfatase A-like enzyme
VTAASSLRSRARRRSELAACARRLASLLAPAFVLVAACSQPESPLVPVYRMNQELLAPGDRNRDCKIGDEVRASIGCVPSLLLRNERRVVGPDGRVALSLTLPVRRRGPVPVLVEVRCWPVGQLEQVDRRAILAPRETPTLAFPLDVKVAPPGAEVAISAIAYELPAPGKRWFTRPLEIGKGAVLEVGLAIHDVAAMAGASPADFRLVARTAGGVEHELLHRLVAPTQPPAWQDERVELADLAGQKVQFSFESTARPRADDRSPEAFTFAIWGAPRILEPRRVDGRYDLVLVSLDTLRADVVGAEVNGERLTPELDALAAEGSSFADVMTTYPSTSAAHMSLFTSTYPSVHGVIFPTFALPATIHTLPEILGNQGYTTAAVTEGGMLAAMSGFRRGFDFYREFSGHEVWYSPRQVERTFRAGLHWIERHRDERFFLFLHTYQVHNPYTPPPEYAPSAQPDAPPGRAPSGRALYEGEVRYTDATVGELVRGLHDLGVLDRAIVAVTSDHGEEFGEHGGLAHARTVYEEVMRIPLILWGPGAVPEGRVVDAPASIVDIVPTLLDLLRLPPAGGVQGQSLVAALRGDAPTANRIRFAEGPGQKLPAGILQVARDRDHKWIARKNTLDEQQIFDLRSDPTEKAPLDDPSLRARGKELLTDFNERILAGGEHAKPAERALDEETEGKLRALGYVD